MRSSHTHRSTRPPLAGPVPATVRRLHRAAPSPTSPLAVTLTDVVLDEIDTHLASPAPEQGGALLRPVNGRAITTFLHDEAAATTRVSYVPSAQLISNVARAEASLDLTLVGVIHSHPNGMNRLSGPDLDVTRHLLQINRHLGWVCMPVVTQLTDEVELGPHEIALAHGRASFFLARLDRDDHLHVATPSTIRALPAGELAASAAVALGAADHGTADVMVGGVATVGIWLTIDEGLTAWVLMTHDYPLAAPLIAIDAGSGIVPLPVATRAATDPHRAVESLVHRLEGAVGSLKPSHVASNDAGMEQPGAPNSDPSVDGGPLASTQGSNALPLTTAELEELP